MSETRKEIMDKIQRECAEKSADICLPDTFPPVTVEDMEVLFAERLMQLGGELVRASDVGVALDMLEKLLPFDEGQWFCSDLPLARRLAEGIHARWVEREALAECTAAVTEAAWLIADTATCALALDRRQPRGCYLLPDVHIVTATADRMLPTLADALMKLGSGADLPTGYVYVTGPSRTADIEKTIVIPAHGPKRLIVVITDR